MDMLTLDVIVPCYQEEDGIAGFHGVLVAVLDGLAGLRWRVLYIDDGSTDGTLSVLNTIGSGDTRVRVYSFSRNFGHQAALSAGLDESGADVVVMMDGDLQHPPDLIPVMLQRYRDGFDIVSSVREETEGVSWLKRAASKAFYLLLNRLSDIRIEPGAADFCLLSRRVREALIRMPERHRFLRGMIAWMGFPRAYVRFKAPPRAEGFSNYTLVKMIRLALDAVFSFSVQPMRMILKTGFVVGVAGLLYLCYEVMRYLVSGDAVRGWPSLMALISVLGGLQLLAIAVSGEYIARIFEESKGRPLYLFKQTPVAQGENGGEA